MELSDWEKLEQLVLKTCLERQCPLPTDTAAKNEVQDRVSRVLGIKPSWVPQVSWRKTAEKHCVGYDVETLRFRSWAGVYGDASLWLPQELSRPVPAILFHHGHSLDIGRFYGPYQRMAGLLASHGVAVLIFDIFGAGSRQQYGHRKRFVPFACGTTVCGMLVLEAMGMFDALSRDKRFDPERIGVMGHSGGGQNTLFLAAELWDRAALAVSSGFASSFESGARKERYLCECNLFPGILHEFEIYHALGCMAPRPVMICSGACDPMVPRDIMLATGHRLETLWPEGSEAFEAYNWNAAHTWNDEGMAHVADFVLKGLGMPLLPPGVQAPAPAFPEALDPASEPMPTDAIDIDQLAKRLTGRTPGQVAKLSDVFPLPSFLSREHWLAMPKKMQDVFIQCNLFADGRRLPEFGLNN